MKKHQIISVPIDDCRPNEYNSNKMPEQKLQALIDTIKRNGQTAPIQVVKDKRGGVQDCRRRASMESHESTQV